MVRTMHNELCRESSPRRCNECFPDISPQTFFMRKRFIQLQLSQVDLFVTPSQYALERYVDWGIPAEKIRVEPCGVRPVDPPAEPIEQRPRNRFAFFGTFTPYKGIDVLFGAAKILGEDFDGHLWIYGANQETHTREFQEKFGAMVDSAGNNVTLAGRYEHDELGKLIERIDWVVVPSIWWETGPVSVFEAFQYGRPVICSDIGGMSEKVAHGVSGLHFRRADPESLADVMRQAVSTPGLWEQLRSGIPAVPLIADHAATMSTLYESLLTDRARAKDDRAAAGA
jgi:glycosyltransferase involved in cell wall biosynthesis